VGQKSQDGTIVVGVSKPHDLPYLQYDDELLKLGYKLTHCNCASGDCDDTPDICILSFEHLQDPSTAAITNLKTHDVPFIISINDESSMENITGHLQKAVGFLFGEPSLTQLALEIEVGLHIHRERTVHSRRVEGVSTKIQNNRDIGVATGLLMAQTHLNALEVFAIMKTFSRNGRIRIATVAREIINLFEQRHPDLSNEIKIENLQLWLTEKLQELSIETQKVQ